MKNTVANICVYRHEKCPRHCFVAIDTSIGFVKAINLLQFKLLFKLFAKKLKLERTAKFTEGINYMLLILNFRIE